MSKDLEKLEYESVSSTDYISSAYKELSVYTAKTRTYPSIYDGMKSVYRRLVYSNRSLDKMTKASSALGEGIKLHPHGDASVAGALVNLSCKFSKFPLFLGKGNWGGMGFEPSGIRYLECKIGDYAKRLYLEYIDYADYEYGETGYEPKYIPSMLPYALLEGSSGIGVGLPNPSIPPLNPIHLVDYYISKLSGDTGKIPHPDYGNLIIDMTDEEVSKVINSGTGRLYLKSHVLRESMNTVVVQDLPPSVYIDTIVNKLQKYIDSDQLEYINESTSTYRYVFKVNDLNVYDEIYNKIKSYTKKTVSVVYLFEKDGQVVSCDFDYIISTSLGLYKSKVLEMTRDKLSKLQSKLDIINAIEYLSAKGILKDLFTIEDFTSIKEDLADQGYNPGTLDSILSRSVKSLCKRDLSSEASNLVKEINEMSSIIDNLDLYLVEKYKVLRSQLLQDYAPSHTSSILQSVLDSRREVKAYIRNNKVDLSPTGRLGVSFDKRLLIVTDDNIIEDYFVPDKYISQVLDIDSPQFILSDKYKYTVLVYSTDHIYVNYTSNLNERKERFRKFDDNHTTQVYQFNSKNVKIISSTGSEVELNLEDYIPKRFSYPSKVVHTKHPIDSIEEVK